MKKIILKKYKKLLAVTSAIVVSVSLTACTVPHTYISIAGKYISDHKEKFPELINEIEGLTESALNTATDNPETVDYFLHFFGISTEDLSSEENADDTQDILPAHQDKPDEKEESAHIKEDTEEKSEAPVPVPTQAPEDKEESNVSAKAEDEQTAETSDTSDEKEISEAKQITSYIKSEYVPEYVHFEKDDFESLCEEFKKAGDENNEKKITSLYDQLVDSLKMMATMNSVAFINFSVNVNETYFDEEYTYTEKLITDCEDLFLLACRHVLESDGSKAFSDHGNPYIIEEAREYEAMSDEEKEMLERETKLENKYNTELDKIDSISCQYKGKTYTVADLYDDSSSLNMLAMFNYNDFLKVYENLLKKINDSLGPIYLELLSIRAEIAKKHGYDSYADYVYEKDYGRSYTTKESADYCEVIKKNIGPLYYQNAYYSLYNSTYFQTEFTTEQVFDILDGFTAGFDSLINNSLKEFREKELYDIANGDGRYNGSYTVSLYSEQLPFIFINGTNDISLLSTLEHEFGHFINDLYEEKDPDYFFINGNYDVFEIHSNSMQLLCSNHYKEIVEETEAKEAKAYELSVQLSSVVEGCIFDEFQRKAYENPDMSLEELNDLYGQISADYGNTGIPGNEYMWVLINHNFESPMYYISYSISALSAMEIWTISQESEDKAIETWLKVMKEADDEDYDTVMKDAGLTPFTDSDGVLEICRKVLDQF